MTAFWMAWIMFWIIPSPVMRWDKEKTKDMLLCMPVIGLFIGGLWALIAWLISSFFEPNALFAALLAAFPWIITGFLHLDGYMDCADAVLSFRDREEKLRILKDSHVGSFAVVMLGMLMLFSYSSFSGMTSLGDKWPALIFIPAVSRACSIFSVLSFRPLETSSYVRMHEQGIGKGYRWLSGLMIPLLIALSFVFCGRYGVSALVCGICSLLTVLKLTRNLGGMSGDISGCALTIGEACAAAALALL